MRQLGTDSQLKRLASLILIALLMGCEPTVGSKFPSDRQKHLVSDEAYLSADMCWGGIGLDEQGVWIPVEFAVDRKTKMTRVGITSRTCELETVVDFERDAGIVPPYFSSEQHAEYFEFMMPNLIDQENLFGTNKLLTSVSTINVIYSDDVRFFDGYMMLGPPVESATGHAIYFNVTHVKR